jgi:Protein of unknown function (DUF3237)
MPEIRTAHLFTMRLKTAAPPQLIGAGPAGDRRVMQVTDGTFEGARLRGTLMPGATDWIIARTDHVLALDVRMVLKTDDGALIGFQYRGMRHGPDDVIARLNRGEAVDPADYYFRMSGFFETGASQYVWLNRLIAVGTGDRKPDGPVYDVFEVL